ncbi:MAG: TIGR03089 family protein [Gordonia sp. (in: high G+C Gram-positive bacteria)]
MADPTLTGRLFGGRSDHTRPLLTYYNGASGERTELSGATLGNWAAKIANYLRDETGLLPGDSVGVDLPEHWQTAAVLLGAWWAGLRVDFPGDIDDARVVFTSADRLDDYPSADELVAVPLDPFALGVPSLPLGVNDFGTSVRPHGDQFHADGAGSEAVAGRSIDDAADAALQGAANDGVSAGDRVLSTRPWHSADDAITNLLGPLLAGASLVWADSDERLAQIAETEIATSVLS